MRAVLSVATLLLAVPASAQKAAAPAELLRTDHEAGRPGGRLVYALRSEPKTLNPVTMVDVTSREVIGRLQADLIHIDRQTQRAGPALAKSWTVSADGLHYTLLLRRGLRFSDGHALDADDVVFTFRCYLDERNASPQRDLLVIGGKPVGVRKLDAFRVAFDLAQPYAAAERLFDSLAILPRHLLEKAQDEGRLGGAWGLEHAPRGDRRPRCVPPQVLRARRAHRARAQPVLLEGRSGRPSSSVSRRARLPARAQRRRPGGPLQGGRDRRDQPAQRAELRRPLRRRRPGAAASRTSAPASTTRSSSSTSTTSTRRSCRRWRASRPGSSRRRSARPCPPPSTARGW